MGIGLGAAKGAALGILYAVIATPPFTLFVFSLRRWGFVYEMFPMVALCSVPAGALVGAMVVLTRSYRRGAAWRAQLAMLVIYPLTGIVFFSSRGNVQMREGLEAAVAFSPVFVPLGLLATWAAVRWIRRTEHGRPGRGVTPSGVHP